MFQAFPMRTALFHCTLGAALVWLPIAPAQAIGFGHGVTSNTLGQSLDFSVRLGADGEEAAELACVFAEVRAGDARLAPELVRATIEHQRASGERRVRVTTTSAIDEPVVTVDVTVGCTARLSRRYVAFVDPPALRLASAQNDDFVPQRVDSQVRPLVDIVNAGLRSPRRDASHGAAAADRGAAGRRVGGASPVRGGGFVSRLVATDPTPRRGGSHASASAIATRSGPRLRLDPAAPVVPAKIDAVPATAAAAASPTDAAANTAAAAAPVAAPSAAPSADAAALAAERERIAGLETALAALRAESQAQQKSLATLQARLRDAESERHANGRVVLLAIALLVAIVLAVTFSALRRHRRNRTRWFDEQARQLQRESIVEAPAAAEPPGPRVSQPPSGWNEGPHSTRPVTEPASIGGLEVTTVLAPQSHYARLAQQEASANTALRPTAPSASPMDELADLEQQAEFFAVIGQDDAAVALLDAHLRRAGGGSPLPYLHLLDIHRRRGHRAAFEQARGEHGPRFAAIAADWEGMDPRGLALEDHVQALGGLQALWATPPEAMRMLEALVLRPSENGAAFDLAACRDLLLLYSVARDLATPPEADDGSIDLYLPLDDTPTVPLRRDGQDAVDLDVSGWPDMPEQELAIRRAVGRRGAG